MEDKVFICVVPRATCHVEWGRVTEEDLMWVEAETGLQEWVY